MLGKETITQCLLTTDMTEENIASLLSIFDNLDRKAQTGKATSNDIEELVTNIGLFTADIPDDQTDIVTQAIQALAKHYLRLLPIIMHTYNEATASQRLHSKNTQFAQELENSKEYTRYLRVVFIDPMISQYPDAAQECFLSRYLGKVPILTFPGDDKIKSTKSLLEMEDVFDKNFRLIKECTAHDSLLPLYLISFFHLNKRNQHIVASSSQKHFFDYLNAIERKKDAPKHKECPGLILASKNIIELSASVSKDYMRAAGMTFPLQNIILISIDNRHSARGIVITLIHEMQHLLNHYHFHDVSSEILSDTLSDENIRQYIEHTKTLKGTSNLNQQVISEIGQILEQLCEYTKAQRSVDELSAHLTELLFTYQPFRIREAIDFLISPDSKTEAIFEIAFEVSKAFAIIENTLELLGVALLHYTKDKALDALKATGKYQEQVIMLQQIEVPKYPSQDHTVYELYDSYKFISSAIDDIFAILGKEYSLHELAKKGQDERLKSILFVSKFAINALDLHGHSPLSYSHLYARTSTSQILEQFGAFYNVQDNTNISILCEQNHLLSSSLTDFRRSNAILLILSNNNVLCHNKIPIPKEILPLISYYLARSDINNMTINDVLALHHNKIYSKKFINLGNIDAYQELQMQTANLLDKIKGILVQNDIDANKKKLTPYEELELNNYYHPRNLIVAIKSIAAVILAQEESWNDPSQSPIKYVNYNKRRLLIQKWKAMVDNKEDKNISLLLLQACNRLAITEINSQLYSQIADLLHTLIIKKKIHLNDLVDTFIKEFTTLQAV